MSTLEQFGAVIQAIARVEADPGVRFWTFLKYVTNHHPEILQVTLQPELDAKATEILQQLQMPPITVTPPE